MKHQQCDPGIFHDLQHHLKGAVELFPKSKTFLKAACFFFLLFSHQTTSNACKCINASNFDTFLHHRAASLLISLDLSTLEISIKYQMCTPKYAFAQKMQDLKNSSILWICCAFHRVFPCKKSKSTSAWSSYSKLESSMSWSTQIASSIKLELDDLCWRQTRTW